jgi:molybdopterin-containing oxidoreductase family iron-sulfur binding subunit
MVIDVSKCIGCRACAVACKSNNNLPNGTWYNRVVTTGSNADEALLAVGGIADVAADSDIAQGSGALLDVASGSYPSELAFGFLPAACQHCGRPLCVEACTAEATWRDEETGIVVIDNEKCIGCKSCIAACPYNARSFNEGEPSYQVDFAFGDADAPSHVANTTEKCTFCANRIERGEAPACMELCLGRCRFWGDLDDPESEVNTYIQGRETFSLLENAGTGPSTIYVR